MTENIKSALAENVNKVTLSTGKVVLMREFKIKHQELALRAAAMRAGDNTIVLSAVSQQEIIKMLVVEVDGQPVKRAQLEDLDNCFTIQEYTQLQRYLEKIVGGEHIPQVEAVSYGSK